MRVITLLPAATEICFALGVEPVGVSHECDHPPEAEALPSVDRSRIDGTGTSAEIDEQVAAAEAGEGVYAVDGERLAALEPDLVVTQGVCDVCAVDRVLVEEAVADRGLDADVATLDVHSLGDLFAAIGQIGTAVGVSGRADALVSDLRDRVAAVRERVPADELAPSVAVLDWMDPVMVAGHWMPEIVEVAGGEYGMEAARARSRPREWRELCEYDPDVLLVSPCGFELSQIRANLADLTARPGWTALSAVESGRVHLVDGHHYVNRAGPRLVDTCEIVAALLWPAVFDVHVDGAVATPSASTV
jgi:iron complex transport system substrate-binding protein